MSKYIEKKTAIDSVHGEFDECLVWDASGLETANVVENILDTLPTADVRPVVRGKWEWRRRHRGGFRRVTGEDDFGVSHTITVDQRYVIDDPYCPFCGKLNESVFLNYCPNCGADMRDDKP